MSTSDQNAGNPDQEPTAGLASYRRNRDLNIMGKFLVWLSGARPDILTRFSHDRAKYVGIGSAVLITACMSAVSMTFALNSVLKITLTGAIPFAVAWGIAILSLDRWLVVSLVRQPNKGSYLLLAIPRLALAVLFGLIISTPITLRIFQPEINEQITQIQQSRSNAYYDNLKSNALYLKVQSDKAQVKNYETVIAANGTGGGVNVSTDPTAVNLKQQLSQAENQEKADYSQWQCQLYGPCHPTGNGPLAKASQRSYLNDVTTVASLKKQLSDQETKIANGNQAGAASNLANARKDLGPAKATLARDSGALTKQETSFNNTNASTAGLLLRLQALSQASASNSALEAARWLLFLFFTVIECLPVTVKVLLNLGPENAYERALAEAERISLRLAEQDTMRQYRRDILAGNELIDESERLYTEWQERVLPGIVRDTTAARERIARERLAAWERAARRGQAGGTADGWTGPGALSSTGQLPQTDWTGTESGLRRPASSNGHRPAASPQPPPEMTRRTPLMARIRAAWLAFTNSATPQPYPGDPTPPPTADGYLRNRPI